MRVAFNTQRPQVGDSLITATCIEGAIPNIAAQYLRNLDIK